jgi:hypothetical protein
VNETTDGNTGGDVQLHRYEIALYPRDGEKMIPTTISKFVFNETGAPRIITGDDQLKAYVLALYELDQRKELTAAEKNYAELLIILIEAYVANHHSIDVRSAVEMFEELMAENDVPQTR